MRSRHWSFLAALAAASGCGAPSGGGCPRDAAYDQFPPVEVIVRPLTTAVKHEVNLDQLSRFPQIESLGPGGKLQGLTTAQHEKRYKTMIAVTEPFFGGQKCAWIDKLTVDLTPRDITIYIPSEYPEESCEYEQLLAHERLHDETHRDVLKQTAEDMRRALGMAQDLPARGVPLAVADRADAENRIEAIIDRATVPVFAEFRQEIQRRQKIIDLPENYRWVAGRCSHWQ